MRFSPFFLLATGPRLARAREYSIDSVSNSLGKGTKEEFSCSLFLFISVCRDSCGHRRYTPIISNALSLRRGVLCPFTGYRLLSAFLRLVCMFLPVFFFSVFFPWNFVSGFYYCSLSVYIYLICCAFMLFGFLCAELWGISLFFQISDCDVCGLVVGSFLSFCVCQEKENG
jgi:hypothetical protein